MRFIRSILVLSMSVVLAFGQAKQDREQPGQKHEKADSGGKNEGIKVHGHWVLEIKNPDGSLASRHEFENSLATAPPSTGPALLGGLLYGQYAAGPWMVYVRFNDIHSTALAVAESPAVCTLLLNLNAPGPCSSTLNVSGLVVLQGTTPAAPFAGSLVEVGSVMYPCFGTVSPVSCEPAAIPASINGNPNYGLLFTTAALSGITIQAGQAVSVTVTITFS